MEPWILHIESSTRTTSIALSQGERLAAQAEDATGDHTRVINDLIRQVLSETGLRIGQLQAISVNEGPGSYTALRIGVVSAKGMAYALDLPLILVPGLKALAVLARMEKPEYHYYMPMLDARRDEVYLAVYDTHLNEIKAPQPALLNGGLKARLGLDDATWMLCGPGAAKWDNFIPDWNPDRLVLEPSAKGLVPLAWALFQAEQFTPVADAKPFYLKEPNITTPKEKLITR